MELEKARARLVAHMERSGALKSPALKEAFLLVPREAFMPEEYAGHAYADDALPIGLGQTISQPSTIAAMLELLDVQEGQRVLEVGAGSGYVLALLKHMVGGKGRVVGVERVGELAARARTTLASLGVDAQVIHGDGSMGLKDEKPFDRILLSAACASVPHLLQKAMAKKGKLVAPVGDENVQQFLLMEKQNGEIKTTTTKEMYVFVPLKQGTD